MQEIIISQVIPLPGEIFTGLITSTKMFGRKNTIVLGFLFSMIFAFLFVNFDVGKEDLTLNLNLEDEEQKNERKNETKNKELNKCKLFNP